MNIDFDSLKKRTHSEQALFDLLYAQVIPDGKPFYVGRLLEHAARNFADSCALICQDEQITFQALFARALSLTDQLKKRGVSPGDCVLVFVENSINFYVAYFGVLQAGAVVVPLNTFLKERELAHIMEDANPALIIASEVLLPVVHAADHDKKIPVMTEHDFAVGGTTTIVEPDTNAMNVLLYTSGTTGMPKGVMLSSRSIMVNVIQSLARLAIFKQARIFGVLPLFHSFAQNTCIWTPFFVGCTVIIVPKIDRRFILEGLRHKPTIFLGVPALYGLLCLMKNAPIACVDYFVSGGDALPDTIRAGFALIYRRKICSGYGMTETSPVISVDMRDTLTITSSVGRPLMGITCSIRDNQAKEVTPGDVGQLWVKGENVMLGYYNAPDMTQATLVDGFLSTGDLAYCDSDGNIVITGRYKDLIIHKGLNIYPQEIENCIQAYPGVIRVGVIGVPDETVGEVPVAYVQLRQVEPDTEKALRALCMNNLAPYKVPRDFICTTNELPITATGKVDKKTLRKNV